MRQGAVRVICEQLPNVYGKPCSISSREQSVELPSASSNALLTFRTSSTRCSSAREKVDRPSSSLMWLVACESQCHECSTCRTHHLLRARGVLPRMTRTPTPGTTSLACCVHHHTDQPLCRLSRRKGSGWCFDSRCSHVCLKKLGCVARGL